MADAKIKKIIGNVKKLILNQRFVGFHVEESSTLKISIKGIMIY